MYHSTTKTSSNSTKRKRVLFHSFFICFNIVFIIIVYLWLIASVIFILEARHAGMPAERMFISKQKPKAARNAQGESSIPGVKVVSPLK